MVGAKQATPAAAGTTVNSAAMAFTSDEVIDMLWDSDDSDIEDSSFPLPGDSSSSSDEEDSSEALPVTG